MFAEGKVKLACMYFIIFQQIQLSWKLDNYFLFIIYTMLEFAHKILNTWGKISKIVIDIVLFLSTFLNYGRF